MAQFSFVPSSESTELADDIRELFDELARTLPHTQRAYSGDCHPSLDVLETDQAVVVVVDVAGVPPEAVRLAYRAGVLIIAGEKAPTHATEQQQFHLVEREFGRFARAVRLNGAFDIRQAHATLRNGELRVVLPKLVDRRGRSHRIPLVTAPDRS